jgi:hypothetical protein
VTVTRVAAADGRLHIEVPLGPGNPYQQYTAPAAVSGTAAYTTGVLIQLPNRR